MTTTIAAENARTKIALNMKTNLIRSLDVNDFLESELIQHLNIETAQRLGEIFVRQNYVKLMDIMKSEMKKCQQNYKLLIQTFHQYSEEMDIEHLNPSSIDHIYLTKKFYRFYFREMMKYIIGGGLFFSVDYLKIFNLMSFHIWSQIVSFVTNNMKKLEKNRIHFIRSLESYLTSHVNSNDFSEIYMKQLKPFKDEILSNNRRHMITGQIQFSKSFWMTDPNISFEGRVLLNDLFETVKIPLIELIAMKINASYGIFSMANSEHQPPIGYVRSLINLPGFNNSTVFLEKIRAHFYNFLISQFHEYFYKYTANLSVSLIENHRIDFQEILDYTEEDVARLSGIQN